MVVVQVPLDTLDSALTAMHGNTNPPTRLRLQTLFTSLHLTVLVDTKSCFCRLQMSSRCTLYGSAL